MGGENCMTHTAIAGAMLFVEGTEHDSYLRFHISAIMRRITDAPQQQYTDDRRGQTRQLTHPAMTGSPR